MLGLYLDLPWWIRGPFAIAVLSFGFWLTFNTQRERAKFEAESKDHAIALPERDNETPFYAGMILIGVGLGLVATCGKTSAEKHGYNSI